MKDVLDSNKNLTKKDIEKMAKSQEEINTQNGRKKGQRNRELTEKEAKKVAYLFEESVEQS